MFYYVVRRLEKYPNNKNMDFVKILPTTTVFKEKMTIFSRFRDKLHYKRKQQ